MGPANASYQVALTSVHPPDNNVGSVASAPGSQTGGGGTTTPATDPATNPVTPPTNPNPIPKADYTQQIASLRKYIHNLESVKNRTPKQEQELQTYIARLADYLNRQAGVG